MPIKTEKKTESETDAIADDNAIIPLYIHI